MPIQFPDFQRITFDQANPWLTGAQQGQNLISNVQNMQGKMLANQIAQVQAKYAEPMTQADLLSKQLANQWNPKLWQSTIGLQGSQAGLYGKEAQWYGPKSQADIALQGAQTAQYSALAGMNQLKQQYLRSKLFPNQNQPSPTPMGPGQTDQGNAQGNGLPLQPGAQGGGQTWGEGGGSGGQTNASPSASSSNTGNVYPQTNSVYGIDTPSPTSDDIGNKMLLGIDTFSPKMQNAQQQQQDQYNQYQKELTASIQEASSGQKMKQILSIFNHAMDNTGMRGAYWGESPSVGWRTMVHPGGSVKNAQIADTQVANLLPGAISDLREAMKSGQFSVADLKAASQMKFSRTMDDTTRQTQTQWVNGVNNRFDEKAKFFTAMGNPHGGATKATADMLWQNYQRQFPLISDDGKTFQGSNLGNWPLYTTPKAIASVKATGTYTPTAAEKNTFMMKYPDGNVLPVKKGGVEKAFTQGARPL